LAGLLPGLDFKAQSLLIYNQFSFLYQSKVSLAPRAREIWGSKPRRVLALVMSQSQFGWIISSALPRLMRAGFPEILEKYSATAAMPNSTAGGRRRRNAVTSSACAKMSLISSIR